MSIIFDIVTFAEKYCMNCNECPHELPSFFVTACALKYFVDTLFPQRKIPRYDGTVGYSNRPSGL
jgi:hypothetical protein